VSLGLNPDGFWRITPRELVARLEGARLRLSTEQDGRAWHAWTVAALMRADKLPDLASMFSDQKPKGPQTHDDQEIALDRLFLSMGGDPKELARVRSQRGQ
jgi:hypothetical protein